MSRELYPRVIHDSTIEAEDFEDVDDAVEAIAEACDGWGTDEGALIEALATKTPEERYKIYYRYEQVKEQNLAERIDSECGDRSFGRAMELLALPSDLAEAKMIDLCCDGAGTNEGCLYPIILGRSNEEIEALKKAYYKLNEEDLGSKLTGELGGDFEKLILNSLMGIEEDWDSDFHTDEKAEEDCDAFYEAGQGSWGTDESEIFKLLCASPPRHLKAMDEKYQEKYEKTMAEALDSELGGRIEDATKYLLGMKLTPVTEATKLVKKSCAGFGTNDLLLTTSLIRYHLILPKMAGVHETLYEKTLLERVESETGGDYGALLSKLVESCS